MIGGGAIGARAIGDTGRREIAGEWGGPALGTIIRIPRDRARRIVVRKP